MNEPKLIVMIARDINGYGAWIENCQGIYGEGNTVHEAKENLLDGLRLFIEHNKELPKVLHGDYEIEYHFDTPSFLQYYSNIFTKSALERMTGINQKQLGHYASGYRNPSEKTIKKIDCALHRLSDELRHVCLAT
jgi:predicted RNase H-like HicB family nuclease